MKKSSALTISIIIMLVALAVLLGLTAFFVDQSVIYPLVLMEDSDVNLRCFLSLKNFNTGYIRQVNNPPSGTLREKILSTYDISTGSALVINYPSLQSIGYSGIFSGNNEQFRQKLAQGVIVCYTRSFGPDYDGFLALYKEVNS
ncbi:MAG: hypothetical protein PHN56_04925 [Candidatus Nanoarchaeia archaeon]|nr:hypothetical protein [Candidatus Nanoarchaeia archaeon]